MHSNIGIKQIDARGISCPEPVIMTKNALQKSPEGVDVLVDSVTTKGNIERFARMSGYIFESEEKEGDYLIAVRKS